ncbi:MAG: ATP-binding protein [Sulfuricurvum sp.]|nr:ATP-binding protein [Sulfuricurvum sp.]
MIKYKWNNLPIVHKLFLALFGGIAIIIIAIISYLWGYESDLMLNKEQDILHTQSISVSNDLLTHISKLQKEIIFLSHLEIMDDMVAQDMDRRITNILEQKALDLGESISLFMVAPDFTVHASSNLIQINTVFHDSHAISKAIKNGQSYFYLNGNLYLFTPVYGSFNSKEFLGYLIMSYPVENFDLQLKTDQNLYRWLTPPASLSDLHIDNSPVIDINAYLHETITLNGALEGWILHYAMPKSQTLATLYHFQTLFLSVFGIALILIGFLVWIIVVRITNPLIALSDTARTIALTGDYTRTVPETGFDEVGLMAHSFNALMYTTQITMNRLKIERENHLEKLVSLIVFFNAITRTKTKEETIEIAMHEIRRFSNAKDIYFSIDSDETDDVTISLNAIGNETHGSIHIKHPELEKESNERFYAALERMLALQVERIELLEKKQTALRAKSAFLSAMSHELRTPLGSILSLTQYLMTQPKTPQPMHETLGKIENSAYHLLGVINNILDLAKAESGKMEPHLTLCDPIKLIYNALDLVSPLAEDKGLDIIISLDDNTPELMSDAQLLGQVVINLLSNAIKYTDDGFIKIELYYRNNIYTLDIIDSGRGIADDALTKIFDEFYQVHAREKVSLEGSGLGLAISKKIALLLRGDLLITSGGPDQGTKASFNFRSF